MAASDPLTRFKTYLERYIANHGCYGRNGTDAFCKRAFVPRDALSSFWNQEGRDEIVNVLCRDTREQPRILADRKKIADDYLVVFSILVFISRAEYIEIFMSTQTPLDDAHLPFSSTPPEEWTYDEELKGVFEQFHKEQWRFCPLTFDRRPWKLKLHPHHIVPITYQRRIGPRANQEAEEEEEDGEEKQDNDVEDDVMVYEADWHPSCRGFLLESNRIVLKVYNMRTQAVTDSLNNEVDVYSNLQDNAFNHIIGYFGSFEQEGKFTIILEHASRGNLKGFWENNALPTTSQDKMELWESFFLLLKALEATHNMNPRAGTGFHTGQWLLKGTHQDIRPQNILITETEGNSFLITFKLTDFGTGHVRRCRKHGYDRMAAQRRGNGMYGPPESVRDKYTTRPQHCKSDVWFLGAVASELLVWSAKGNAYRIKYQEERRKATDQTALKGGYHDGCFHDGERRLQVVDEMHRSVLESIDDHDFITPIVSRIILDYMLVANVDERSSAAEAYAAWRTQLSAALRTAHVPQKVRRSTRDSHVSSTFFSSQTPWLAQPMSSEPGQHHGHDQTATHNPISLRHVQFGERRGGGIAGPSSLHHGHGFTPGLGRGVRQGTTDSLVFGNIFETIPEGPGGETTPPPTRTGVPFSPPSRPFGPGLSRSATSASNRTLSMSPPSMPSKREPVDDHYGVAEPGESSTSGANQSGLNIYNNGQAASSLPSPPGTPAVKRVDTALTNRSALTASRRSFSAPQRAPTMIADAEKITVDHVYDRIVSPEKEKGIMWSISSRRKKPDLLNEFPRLKEAVKKLKGLNGREQIFIIDDATSMFTHRYEMGRTLRVLARLLKVGAVDPDKKFTVYHTCDLSATIQVSNATALQEHVEKQHRFSSMPCNIQEKLDTIVTEILKSTIPVSVYVLTNGRWNALPGKPQDLCGVDSIIERILVANKNYSRESNHVGFQFIRFYRDSAEDKEGKQRLQYLDDCLPDDLEGLETQRISKKDIIDTTDWDDDVCKMLLGGVYIEEDNAVFP